MFLKSDLFETLTTSLALLASWAGFVQAYKIFSLQNALALSLPAVCIGVLNGLCWLLYGWSRKIKPLVTSNIVGLISSVLIIIGIMIY